MSFKLPQPAKDFFDIIRAIGSYLGIAAFGIFLLAISFGIQDVRETLIKDFSQNVVLKAVIIIIGIIFIIAPIVIPYTYNNINRFILRKRNLSDIIVEKQEITIDIIENGRIANYFEKVIFYRIGGKSNNHYNTFIIVDGTVEDIYASNCLYKLDKEKKEVMISYRNDSYKLNKYPRLIKGRDKFFIFSATFKDTFTNAETEYWDLTPMHYCINFTLQVNLPTGTNIKWVKIFTISEDGNEEATSAISPIVYMENGRQKILLHIVDYDYSEVIRVKWAYIKTPNHHQMKSLFSLLSSFMFKGN